MNFARRARQQSGTCLALYIVHGLLEAELTEKEVNSMVNKIFAAVLALSLFGLAIVSDVSAKRRCPRGQVDINNVCVSKPHR